MLKRHPLTLFFVLAFLLPWSVWGTTLAEQRGLLAWHLPSSLAFWLGLPVATFTAAAVTAGWPAVQDLLLRMVRGRVSVAWYALATLLTAALAAAAGVLGGAFGVLTRIGSDVSGAALPALLALDLWMFLITEETAWRGFALPRLQARMSPLSAAVLLGTVWGLWHLPLFLTAGTFQSRIPFPGFLLSTVATSVLVSRIFDSTRGSVLLAAVFHAATDVAIAFSGVMSSGLLLFWIFVALQCLAAAAVASSLRSPAPPSAVWRDQPAHNDRSREARVLG